jgi:hypothetical protein
MPSLTTTQGSAVQQQQLLQQLQLLLYRGTVSLASQGTAATYQLHRKVAVTSRRTLSERTP